MPIYEYSCSKCNSEFEVMSISPEGFKNVVCPECESKNVLKKFSTFAPFVGGGKQNMPCGDISCEMPSNCPSAGMCGFN